MATWSLQLYLSALFCTFCHQNLFLSRWWVIRSVLVQTAGFSRYRTRWWSSPIMTYVSSAKRCPWGCGCSHWRGIAPGIPVRTVWSGVRPRRESRLSWCHLLPPLYPTQEEGEPQMILFQEIEGRDILWEQRGPNSNRKLSLVVSIQGLESQNWSTTYLANQDGECMNPLLGKHWCPSYDNLSRQWEDLGTRLGSAVVKSA